VSRHRPPSQPDLFGPDELFPVRRPADTGLAVDLPLRIKTAMGQALKECPDNAGIVAARMSEMVPDQPITTAALYTYTAPSKPEHDMGIMRFVAFVRATRAFWLWDLLVQEDGLVVMEGREAHLATLGLLRQQRQQVDEAIRTIERDLKAEPVKVATCARRSPAVRGQPPLPTTAAKDGGKP
jgi:hypothetical protein